MGHKRSTANWLTSENTRHGVHEAILRRDVTTVRLRDIHLHELQCVHVRQGQGEQVDPGFTHRARDASASAVREQDDVLFIVEDFMSKGHIVDYTDTSAQPHAERSIDLETVLLQTKKKRRKTLVGKTYRR